MQPNSAKVTWESDSGVISSLSTTLKHRAKTCSRSSPALSRSTWRAPNFVHAVPSRVKVESKNNNQQPTTDTQTPKHTNNQTPKQPTSTNPPANQPTIKPTNQQPQPQAQQPQTTNTTDHGPQTTTTLPQPRPQSQTPPQPHPQLALLMVRSWRELLAPGYRFLCRRRWLRLRGRASCSGVLLATSIMRRFRDSEWERDELGVAKLLMHKNTSKVWFMMRLEKTPKVLGQFLRRGCCRVL